jgi:hypothetical protein
MYVVNASGDPTVIEEFENELEADEYIILNPGLQKTETWYVQEFFLALDDNPGFRVLYLGMNAQRAPLNDLSFRLALANLTDRNTHYNLIGTDKDIGHSPVIPQNAYWYNSSIPIYKLEHYTEDNAPILGPVNLELDQAGYLNFGGPFRDLPNGTKFDLTLQVPPITISPPESAIGASILDLLNQVGINTTIHYDTWEGIRANVSNDNFDLALGMLETDVDPFFLYDSFHSSRVGSGSINTNYNNYVPVETMVNETLQYDTIRIDPVTKLGQMARTNLLAGSEIVYRNDTVWPSSNYSMDYENGTLTVQGQFDFQNDTLNITYDYRILDFFLEGANGALDLEDRQEFVRGALGVIAGRVPMIPLVYYKTQEAYDRTVFDGWVGMLGGINNFWSYINVKYIPIGHITVDVSSNSKTLKSNQTANLIITATNQEGEGIGGVYLQLHELNGLGVLTDVEGYTEPDGFFYTKYATPTVTDVTDVTIVAKGAIDRYFEDEGTFSITVYPDLDEFAAELTKESTTIESGKDTQLTLTVSSKETGLPVSNANVTLEISPSDFDASVETYQGVTDSTGTFITRFSASVTTQTFFRITAKVSKDGFDDKQASTSVNVNPIYVTEPPAILGIAEISLIALVIALLVLYLLISLMYKEKKPVTKEEDAKEEIEEEPKKDLDAEESDEEKVEEPDDDWADEEKAPEEEELEKEKSDSE